METLKAVTLKTSFIAENPESAIQNSPKNSCSVIIIQLFYNGNNKTTCYKHYNNTILVREEIWSQYI